MSSFFLIRKRVYLEVTSVIEEYNYVTFSKLLDPNYNLLFYYLYWLGLSQEEDEQYTLPTLLPTLCMNLFLSSHQQIRRITNQVLSCQAKWPLNSCVLGYKNFIGNPKTKPVGKI